MNEQLRDIFRHDERPAVELERMFDLIRIFLTLPTPPDPLGMHASYPAIKESLVSALGSGDAERIETAFLDLYCNAHGNEAPYTTEERARMDETGGYWCHAGGISPLVKAGPWITAETVSADFGAGNGLQGLLLQKLYPHRMTVQIEISSTMVECGKQMQKWLGIPQDRVRWAAGDVMSQSAEGYDFIYLYRPLKPDGVNGALFYRKFAQDVSQSDKPLVIFSIADCLRDLLPETFKVFYEDGHLSCFRRTAPVLGGIVAEK